MEVETIVNELLDNLIKKQLIMNKPVDEVD